MNWLLPLSAWQCPGRYRSAALLPPLLENLRISRCSECTATSQKLFERLVFVSGQPFCAVQLCCCRGLFSAWNRMVSREHSGGWALQCTAVLVALLRTPTLFHSCSASDSLSISRSISRPLSPILASFVSLASLHFLLIAFVLFLPIPHTLKANRNSLPLTFFT